MTNLAAALTYRSVLSVFPGLIALEALLGVLGQYPQTFDALLRIVAGFAPSSTVQSVSGPVRQIITHKGGASALLGVGLAARSGGVGSRGHLLVGGECHLGGQARTFVVSPVAV